MYHIDNSDLRFMSESELKNEIISERKIQRKMNDQLMELKIKVPNLLIAERSLKKERGERHELNQILYAKDKYIQHLNKELDKVSAMYIHERDQKDAAEKGLEELQKDYQEVMMESKQKDDEIFNLRYPNNEHLSESEKKSLPRQVEDLKDYRRYASTKLEEQREELEQIHTELTETKKELRHTKKNANRLDSEMKFYKKECESYKKTREKEANEIMICRTNAYRDRRRRELSEERHDLLEDLLNQKSDSCTKLLEEKDKLSKQNSEQVVAIAKLEKKIREMVKLTEAKDQEIVHFKNLACESETKVRQIKFYTMAERVEKNLIYENMFRAQDHIQRMTKTKRRLKDQIKNQSREIKAKTTELSEILREHRTIKREVEKMRRRRIKVTKPEVCDKSVTAEEQVIMKETLAVMEVEQDMLEKTLIKVQELEGLQTDLQSAKEQIVKYTDDIQLLQQENKTLKHDLYISDQRRVRVRRRIRRDPANLQMMDIQHQEIAQLKHLLKERDRRIEDLIEMMGWLPDETRFKLETYKLDKRDLNKKLMSSNVSAKAYIDLYNKEREKNKMLTDELRNFKLEYADLSRYTHLPPIKAKAKSVPEDASKDKSQRQTAPKSKLNCHAIQIMPQPPPEKKSQKIESKPPEDILNSSKVGKEICEKEVKNDTQTDELRGVTMSGCLPSRNRLPPIQIKAKSQRQTEPKSKPDSPPSELNCHAIQIMPQPPPEKKSQKIEFKPPENTLNSSEVGKEICEKEDNTQTDEPRGVKVSRGQSSRTRLPPIQTKAKSLAEGMPKDKCESGQTSRRARFRPTSTTSQLASAQLSKPDSTPNELKCQIKPHPPPPKKMGVKSPRRTLKRPAQIKKRDHPAKVSDQAQRPSTT